MANYEAYIFGEASCADKAILKTQGSEEQKTVEKSEEQKKTEKSAAQDNASDQKPEVTVTPVKLRRLKTHGKKTFHRRK